MTEFEHYIRRLSQCRCLVIGDTMLDEYIYGSVARISPEAPVPVVEVHNTKYTLGGAANVAAGIRKLGASCTLVGVIGADSDAVLFLEKLRECGVTWAGITATNKITTKKTRIIGNLHQLVRLDQEVTDDLPGCEEDELLRRIEVEISSADIVIISDYRKGACTARVCQMVVQAAEKNGKLVLVDPKHPDWTRYSGAYLIKPNLKEFCQAAKTEAPDLLQAAAYLRQQFHIRNILITRSQEGMTLVGEAYSGNYRAQAHEVFDVSGAGDTVIAALAVFLAAGAGLAEAVRLSNIAAGISVSRFGTYAVGLDEVKASMQNFYSNKIVPESQIDAAISQFRESGKKIVFTNGCFDILHTGHVSLLEQARQFGDALIVGLNSDDSVRRLKGTERPINHEWERAKILSALECVDAVIIFGEDTPLHLIERILPDVLVKGADYTLDKVVGANAVQAHGGRVELVPLVREKSTTGLIRKLHESKNV